MFFRFVNVILFIGIFSIASSIEIEGFRDMKWGDSPKKFGKIATCNKDVASNITACTKKLEKLEIGSGMVNEVIYRFYNNKLYSVALPYSTDDNYKNLKYALTIKYGEPSKPHSHLDWYYWKSSDGTSNISLEHNKISSEWNSGSGMINISTNLYDQDIASYQERQEEIKNKKLVNNIKNDL